MEHKPVTADERAAFETIQDWYDKYKIQSDVRLNLVGDLAFIRAERESLSDAPCRLGDAIMILFEIISVFDPRKGIWNGLDKQHPLIIKGIEQKT